jgi:Ni/Co efflux regulator RcnB
MKRQSILGAVTALGIISSSIASTTLMGTTAALADDWSNSNDRPAWSQRCDRDWDNTYCNPKVAPIGDRDWSDPYFNRNQSLGNGEQDRWGNSDRVTERERDSEYWRNQQRSSSARLPEGTDIPTYFDRGGRRIVLRRSERYPLTLIVSQDVGYSRRGRVTLPRNSRIEGELVPTRNGYRFEANRVRFPNGQQQKIWAVSNTLRQNNVYDRDVRRDDNLSSGAGGILGSIFGRSNSTDDRVRGDIYDRYPNAQRDVAIISPDRSLDLRLTRDFVMDWRNF